MSIEDCLSNAVKGKELTQAQADAIQKIFDAKRRENRFVNMSSADLLAQELTWKLLEQEKGHRRMVLAKTLKVLKELNADLGDDVGANALAKLFHLGDGLDGFSFSSIEGRRLAIVGQMHDMMEEMLLDAERSWFSGQRHNQVRMENVVRELFGEDTADDAAKAFAKAWSGVAETLRRRYNDAGGAIQQLQQWGLPQHHDARAVRNVGKDAWIKRIRDMLAPDRMRNPLTGDPIDVDELDHILGDVWNQIVTDGGYSRPVNMVPYGKGAMSNRRMEHRFLVFKDAENWLEYQKEFGYPDSFASMMDHVSKMARDIAAMEILGPNPDGMMQFIRNLIAKERDKRIVGEAGRIKGKNPEKKASRQLRMLDGMWDEMRGRQDGPTGSFWHDTFFPTLRNTIHSAVMGSAVISGLGDVGTQAIARRFAGLSNTTTGLDVISHFGIQGKKDALGMSMVHDDALSFTHRMARYTGTLEGGAWSRFLPDRTMTWSGLIAWTAGQKRAFHTATMVEFGARMNDSFDSLPDGMQRLLRRYGLTPGDWDKMRNHAGHEVEGVRVLRPREIREVDQSLADRYLEMVIQETEYAVPSGNVRSRAALSGGALAARDTWWGEVQRSFNMFKSYGAAYAMSHGQRTAMMLMSGEKGARAYGARYAVTLLLTMTMMGALSMQLKNIIAGRDPQSADSAQFWGAALLQGGGLGIYGDFLFSDLNRFGGGFGSTIGGPMIDRLDEFWTLTGGNMLELAQSKETHAGRELTRFLKGITPFSNIWYIRNGYERVISDSLQFLLDPEANQAFKDAQRRREADYGQKYWWGPGSAIPQRLPDIGLFNP